MNEKKKKNMHKKRAQKHAMHTDDNRRSSFQIFQLINISKSIRGCMGFTNPGIFINYCLRTWLGVFLMDLIQRMAIYSRWTFIVNTELLVLNVQNRLLSTCLNGRWTLKWFICLTDEFYGHAHVSHQFSAFQDSNLGRLHILSTSVGSHIFVIKCLSSLLSHLMCAIRYSVCKPFTRDLCSPFP